MTKTKTTKFWLRTGSIIALFVIIAGYGIFSAKDLLFGVKLTINSVHDGQVFTNPLVQIEGVAAHARELTINDRLVPVDQQGNFKEPVLLSPGYSVMTMQVKDKFGKSSTETLHLFFKES